MSADSLDLLIRGDLVLQSEFMQDGAAGVRDGKIVGLYTGGEIPPAAEVIDCRGHLVFPGIVDAHVHSYSMPGAEGFEYSTAAAAAGGVTTIIEMPYDAGSPTRTPEAFQEKAERVRRLSRVDVALLATLKKEGSPEVIAPLVKLGACGFKLSLFETDPERFPRIPDGVLWEILPLIAAQGVPVGFHAEDDELIFHLIRRLRREGRTFPRAHGLSRPPASETLAVLKLLELARWTGARLHLYHVSHPRSVGFIRKYRKEGVDVTAETCPHYLILRDEDLDQVGARGKINPPLQAWQDVEDLWRSLQEGAIDMVTSDHAPWPLEQKKDPDIFANASGAPGVETLFPLMYHEAVGKRGLSPVKLAHLLCENPARRFKLYPRKGRIGLMADADFAVLDPAARWTVEGQEMRSSAKWTPFEGKAVEGKVVRTILRGRTIFDGREVNAGPGNGCFVPAGDGS